MRKLAPGIQTYHAAGWKFRRDFDRSTARKHDINRGKKNQGCGSAEGLSYRAERASNNKTKKRTI